jgi:hypothetical protein
MTCWGIDKGLSRVAGVSDLIPEAGRQASAGGPAQRHPSSGEK